MGRSFVDLFVFMGRLLPTLSFVTCFLTPLYGSPIPFFKGYILVDAREMIAIPVELSILPKSSSGAVKWVALLKIEQGETPSLEYATYTYDLTAHDWTSERIDLIRYEFDSAQSLPRIHMARDSSDPRTWSGVVRSVAAAYPTRILLREGSHPPEVDAVLSHTMAGHYRADECRLQQIEPRLNPSLSKMVLYPNRASSDQMLSLAVAEAALKITNYLGYWSKKGLLRDGSEQEVIAQELHSGRFNFYNQTLEVNYLTNLLFCSRAAVLSADHLGAMSAGPGDLWCKNRHLSGGGCWMRYETGIDDARDRQISLSEITRQPRSTPMRCDEWSGSWKGMSRLDGRQLPTEVYLHATQDAEHCAIYADMTQKIERSRPIVQRFEVAHLLPGDRGLTLFPVTYSDAVLVLSIDESQALHGQWYSTIYGRVGDIELSKDPKIDITFDAEQTEKSPVYALAGTYRHPSSSSFAWKTQLFNAGIDVNFLSADPSRMFSFAGMTEAIASMPVAGSTESYEGRAINMLATRALYFDYFTNRFLIRIQNERGDRRHLFGSSEAEGLRAVHWGVVLSTLDESAKVPKLYPLEQ